MAAAAHVLLRQAAPIAKFPRDAAAWGGPWRPVVRAAAADAFLDCGDLRHGFARLRCENPACRHEVLLAYSCHGRYFCPSCHAKRVAAFADWLVTEVLEKVPTRPWPWTG